MLCHDHRQRHPLQQERRAVPLTIETRMSASSWIRGVNLGGWLLAERFITPYLFAVNSCQLRGDFCFHPDQIDSPPTSSRQHVYCDLGLCQPHLIDDPTESDAKDYPMDEKSLLGSFDNKAVAKQYMTFHWENFVQKDDVQFLSKSNVEYVKVPMPHYVMNDILDNEPWVDGQWLFFLRFAGWCREYNIKIWIDMHTSLPDVTTTTKCKHWITSPENVERSLNAVKDISQAVMDDNLRDVVTGFGILNTPYAQNCPGIKPLQQFSNEAFKIVRSIMGNDTSVFMTDSLNAVEWNDGWWNDPDSHSNTYLDSHYYHVFYEHERALSPKQHVAYTCDRLSVETASCCYDDHPNDKTVSEGVSRIVGEWSAAFDIQPQALVKAIMQEIHDPKFHKAALMQRSLSAERKRFLAKHVQAQMVAYENANTGVSSGWFFYTLKVEGGAFAEWDFTRGIKEGWIHLAENNHTTSESIFGSCRDIVEKTDDDDSIIQQYPDPQKIKTTPGPAINDDYVLSQHVGSSGTKSKPLEIPSNTGKLKRENRTKRFHWFRFFALILFCYGIWHVFLKDQYGWGQRRGEYSTLNRQFNF